MKDNLAVKGIDEQPEKYVHGRKPRRIIPIYCKGIGPFHAHKEQKWGVWKRYREQSHADQAFETITKTGYMKEYFEFSLTNPDESL